MQITLTSQFLIFRQWFQNYICHLEYLITCTNYYCKLKRSGTFPNISKIYTSIIVKSLRFLLKTIMQLNERGIWKPFSLYLKEWCKYKHLCIMQYEKDFSSIEENFPFWYHTWFFSKSLSNDITSYEDLPMKKLIL